MQRKREIFGCLNCEKRDVCPIENDPVPTLLRDDLFLECVDFVEMWETFSQIKEKIKEKKCGVH